MRRLPASSAFRGPKLGKQGLRTEFRYQGIISYSVVEGGGPQCAVGMPCCRVIETVVAPEQLTARNKGRAPKMFSSRLCHQRACE